MHRSKLKTTILARMAPVLSLLFVQASATAADQVVEMQTTKGPIFMRIFYGLVPYTASNFLDLVEQGFYNGLTFHRVENWCIQGGDPNGNGTGHYIDPNTGQPKFLRLEVNRSLSHNAAGTVAMARSNNPDSASCQFYILKSPMQQLDGKYAIFGRVLNGMQAVYAIRPGDRILSARILPPPGANTSQEQNAQPTAPAESGPAPRPVEPGF